MIFCIRFQYITLYTQTIKMREIQNLFKTYLKTFSILEILSSILAVFSKLQASSFMNQKTYNWMNILSDDSSSAPLWRKWYSLSNLLIIPFICKMFNKVEKEHKNPLFYEAKILQIYLENGATNSCNPFPGNHSVQK